MKLDTSASIFRKVLVRGSLLIAAIALAGSIVGGLVAGGSGVASALIGASMTLVFVSITALSVWLGAKLPIGGFFGVVMGAWLVKMVIFIILVRVLQDVEGINHPVLGFTLIAAILGSLAVDALTVAKSRQPIVEN